MKVIDYCDRTHGIGTNPNGGIFVTIKPETPEEKEIFGDGEVKIYERLVKYPGDGRIPMDGGPNPEWRKLVEHVGEPFWEKIESMYKQYEEEVKERIRKLKTSLAIKVANGKFRAFRDQYLNMIHVIPIIRDWFSNHKFTFFPDGQNDLNLSNSFFTVVSVEEGKLEEIKDPEMLERIKEFFLSKLDEMD